jgi:hypothetical protein
MREHPPLERLARFEAGHYRPVTFLQRGVAMPFTTPYLLGGRIRPGEFGMPELVLANPAGDEGVYIMPWSSLPDLCILTLHDRALWSRTAELVQMAPRTVREVARRVAAEGFAGRAAAAAATAAITRDQEAETLVNYHLLVELVRQREPAGPAGLLAEAESTGTLEARARAALAALDPANALSLAAASAALGEVAEAYAYCGLRRNPTAAPVPALIAEIGALMQELSAWAASHPGPERSCVRLIGQGAELTLRCCRRAMADAHAPLSDLGDMLPQWPQRRELVLALAARPEWLLDGWGSICGLWRGAGLAQRRTALLDMASLVPVIPSEVNEWLGFDAATDMDGHRGGLRRWRRTVQSHEDWMTGRMLDLITRNEALRCHGA